MDDKFVGQVADALIDLSDTDKKILGMTYVDGLNSTEIAKRLGMQPSAVRMRHQRMLDKLAGNSALQGLAGRKDDLDDLFEEARTYPYPMSDFSSI